MAIKRGLRWIGEGGRAGHLGWMPRSPQLPLSVSPLRQGERERKKRADACCVLFCDRQDGSFVSRPTSVWRRGVVVFFRCVMQGVRMFCEQKRIGEQKKVRRGEDGGQEFGSWEAGSDLQVLDPCSRCGWWPSGWWCYFGGSAAHKGARQHAEYLPSAPNIPVIPG